MKNIDQEITPLLNDEDNEYDTWEEITEIGRVIIINKEHDYRVFKRERHFDFDSDPEGPPDIRLYDAVRMDDPDDEYEMDYVVISLDPLIGVERYGKQKVLNLSHALIVFRNEVVVWDHEKVQSKE